MAAGPVLGTKVFTTHLQEREGGVGGGGRGKGEEATQMRPMKRTDWINGWWGRSEGKPFHQVLEIQAAGS